MRDSPDRPVDSIRSLLGTPEYTGSNRCGACTVANLALLAAGVATASRYLRPWVGLGLGVVGLAAIWLRGYLVPYTPAFAPRIVDALPVGPSGSVEPADSGSLADDASVRGDRLVDALVAADVLVADGPLLSPSSSFDERWRAAMNRFAGQSLDALAATAVRLADLEGATPVRDGDDEWIAVENSHTLVARPVLVAELGAIRALEGRIEDRAVRVAAAGPLRQFLTACPDCGTQLDAAKTVDCCGGHAAPRETPRERRVCPLCEQLVAESPPAPADEGG